MYEPKTKPTRVPVSAYIGAMKDEERRRDCRRISSLLRRITGSPARMWGPSIIGFGRVHYEYATGHQGDTCEVGFSSRKPDIVVYLLPGYDKPETKRLLARLGKHKTGKSCLYIRRLADVDVRILEQLVKRSVTATRRLYPKKRA